jgi:hypothetical protein
MLILNDRVTSCSRWLEISVHKFLFFKKRKGSRNVRVGITAVAAASRPCSGKGQTAGTGISEKLFLSRDTIKAEEVRWIHFTHVWGKIRILHCWLAAVSFSPVIPSLNSQH